MLDAGANIFERERVLPVNPRRIANRNARLADPAKALGDEPLVPLMEGLIASDEQRRWPVGVKNRPQLLRNLLSPVFRGSVGRYTYVEAIGWDEQRVGVLICGLLDAIDPDYACLAPHREGGTGLRRRADEIRHRKASRLDDLIAEPAHPAGLLDAVDLGKTQVFI